MSVDLHPEPLIVRAKRGQLTREEQAKLEQHLQVCVVCRLELGAHGELAEIEDPLTHKVRERLVQGALSNFRSATKWSEVPRWAAVAAVIFAFVGSATAAFYGWQLFVRGESGAKIAVPEPRAKQLPAVARDEPGDAGDIVRTEDVVVSVRKPLAKKKSRRRAERGPNVGPPDATFSPESRAGALSAAALLEMASKARRQRRFVDAREKYDELLRQFPESREASVARISVARILLHNLSQPAAALKHFEYYLRVEGQAAALRADALSGRASALGRLGRHREETNVWRQLVREHPSSHHVARAEQRLRELETALEESEP